LLPIPENYYDDLEAKPHSVIRPSQLNVRFARKRRRLGDL
jgi:hypothetical protein